MSIKHLAYLFVFSVFAAGCAASLNVDNEVIAVVGNKQITYGEFKKQYAENALPVSDTAEAISSKENFLNLLVDYDLKLLDAKKENLREDPAVKSEMESYETQLAIGYVLEHELTEPTVKQIYERSKFEVRAQQVFIQIKPDSLFPAGDTLKAYDEAVQVIKDLKAGVPIDSLMKLYRGGDSYYITAGNYLQYVGGQQFEDMLYTLKPGEVGATPIRTAYGYLVLKLTDRRPRVESISASHILIRIPGNTPADTLEAYNKAVAVLDSAKAGVDFGKLALDNSADTVSAKRGGALGTFSRGMMVRPFEEAAFDTKVGGITGPVRTQFGYHIIKVTGATPVPPFAQVKEQIRSKYLQGGYKLALDNFVGELEHRYDYRVNRKALLLFEEKLKPAKSFAETDFDSLISPAEMKDSLFTFDNEVGTLDTVLAIARKGDKFSSMIMNANVVNQMIDEASKDMVLAHYANKQAQTYPDFEELVTKYENGILIYQIEQRHVWGKISASDSVLKPYFESHEAKYVWPKRVDLSRIKVRTAVLADSAYDMIRDGADFDSVAAKFEEGNTPDEKNGHWGVFPDSANILVTVAFNLKPGQYSNPLYYDGSYSIIRVDKFLPPGPMTYEEARPEVAADYQDYESKRLQSDWLEKLKNEFGVKIDQKKFHELLAKG